MIKVITYGTYDLLHYGHIKLLERAKALGDYLIVGITSDDYDKARGKINNQQSLVERISAVMATGLVDEIIVEEYEGQKIDDIKRHGIDIFTVGSDWKGVFDYLGEFCKVVYLERTEGISSSELRAENRSLKMGIVGNSLFLNKVLNESCYVNGLEINSVYTDNMSNMSDSVKGVQNICKSFDEVLEKSDVLYICSDPTLHYEQIKKAFAKGKHVLCESPIAVNKDELEELFAISKEKNLVLMEAIKTAYSTAYSRLLLLLKGGKIGDVVSVDATCTSLRDALTSGIDCHYCLNEWGPTAMLPVFHILGTDVKDKYSVAKFDENNNVIFAKVDFTFENATATIKIGDGVKSEGSLVISGTKGYVYVPAPWWNTEYFEVRYEDPKNNKRYFYQLDGEGIRYELVAFVKAVETAKDYSNIPTVVSKAICGVCEDFYNNNSIRRI